MRGLLRGEMDVARDAHRWCGLVRFHACDDGILRARIAPEQEVLDAIALHFAGRMRGERWIIVDATHEKSAVFDGRHYEIRAAVPGDLPPAGAAPDMIEGLWQTYFRTIAIPERHNPALQRRCLPRKVRQDLVELAGENAH